MAWVQNLCFFVGHISIELRSFNRLETPTLQGNNLFGPIPASLQNCLSFQYLFLNDNNLSSTQLIGFEDLTILWPDLYAFSISNNKLEGNLPLSFASLNSTIALIDYSMNNFAGGLSTQVNGSHLSSLQVLLISYNQLEGPIPSWIGGGYGSNRSHTKDCLHIVFSVWHTLNLCKMLVGNLLRLY